MLIDQMHLFMLGNGTRSRVELPLKTSEGDSSVTLTAAVYRELSDEIVLFVHNNSPHDGATVGVHIPELVAEAVAVYQHNTEVRKRAGKPVLSELVRRVELLRASTGREADCSLDLQLLPAVVLTGTFPTFFKIPLTLDVVQAVLMGERPAHETVVAAFTPTLPSPGGSCVDCMRPLDNRRVVLQCFEAFNKFV